jgi:predicted ArsR family transcriptional regulator
MSKDGAPRLGPTRAEVLDRLRAAGRPLAVSEVSEAVGLHPNTTRFHLDALTDAGLAIRDMEHRERPGRPKLLYRAAHAHRESGYQDLAGAMVRHFAGTVDDRARHALAAGETWGAELRAERALAGDEDALTRLVGSLDGLGYSPELRTGDETVLELHRCPYVELADDDPEVVCTLHLGLVRGLLGPDQPWTVTAIQPWVGPSTCEVRLVPAGGDARADA